MMDIKINCPHCNAKAGEICTLDCSANGKKIQKIEVALKQVGLGLRNIMLTASSAKFGLKGLNKEV